MAVYPRGNTFMVSVGSGMDRQRVTAKTREEAVCKEREMLGNHRVVVEVQASALSITAILKRTLTYSRRGINMLWVVPLHAELTGAQFRPRLYERYFHSIYFGRTYYWWPGRGATVLPVHYGVARRHIPYAEWYEQGGEHVEVGGYEVDYKAIKKPLFGVELEIGRHFTAHKRGTFTPENERKAVPECHLWWDHMEPWWDTATRSTGGAAK